MVFIVEWYTLVGQELILSELKILPDVLNHDLFIA